MSVQAAVEQTYLDSQDVLRRVVRGHLRRYGGDPEEAMADATLVLVLAWHGFRHGGTVPWDYRLAFLVSRRLLSARRTELRRDRLLPRDYEADLEAVEDHHRRGFDLEDFVAGLGSDAGTAVRIALRTPRVRERLSRMGWSRARVRRTVTEVREALCR